MMAAAKAGPRTRPYLLRKERQTVASGDARKRALQQSGCRALGSTVRAGLPLAAGRRLSNRQPPVPCLRSLSNDRERARLAFCLSFGGAAC